MTDSIEEINPIEDSRPRLSSPKKVAAGIPAVLSSMNHSVGNMGVLNSLKTLSKVNDFSGFDCPGCAWPDPDGHRSFAEFCENGAKAVADEGTKKRIDADFFSYWSVSKLSEQSDYWLNKQGRITRPFLLRQDSTHYEPIEWDEAFSLIADELISLDSPDDAIFYTSGRTSNEAAFLWQLLARRFGTNNLPDCSNMCHESSGVALNDSIGIGKGTVTLDDFNHADLIMVVGQNPGTNHPRMLTALRDAKKNGASIISINPLSETGLKAFKHPQNPLELLGRGTELADAELQVSLNGDQALFRGFSKLWNENDLIDFEFVQKYTHGFQDYSSLVSSTKWSEIESHSGLSEAEIRNVFSRFKDAKSIIICWAMGITQHKNAVATIQEITNFLLLGGNIGRAGAGVCPVRGHSNVQGDRTVGINHKPTESFSSQLDLRYGISSPRGHGCDAVEAVRMMEDTSRVFLSMGGNFLSAMSDTHRTAKGLKNCSLTAIVSTKLNRSHLVTGRTALILPCLGRTEKDLQENGLQFVSVENSMGIVHSSTGNIDPASNTLLSEPAIVCGIASALESRAPRSSIDWESFIRDYSSIRDEIEAVIPGFDNYNERIRQPAGFYLPNPPRDSREFNTNSGKANFRSHSLESAQANEGEFLMMTIRSHDQYNTTIYGLNDRYRGIHGGRRIVLMNNEDMIKFGFSKSKIVDLSSSDGSLTLPTWHVIAYDIPQGTIATYFPEANPLIPLDSVALGSNTPTSKSVPVIVSIAN